MNEHSKSDGNAANSTKSLKMRRTTMVPTSSVNARRKCAICRTKEVDYPDSRYGATCKTCWLALKLLGFDYHNLRRAMRSVRRKPKRSVKIDGDVRFARLVKEAKFVQPIRSIPQVKVVKKEV